MNRTIAAIIALVLLLLCGCAATGEVGDATSAKDGASVVFTASNANDTLPYSLEGMLVAENGAWRSEQQRPEDPVVIVRELTLGSDGSLSYREGDWASEFSYFAEGSWTLEDSTLVVQFTECDEAGQPLPDARRQHAAYAVEYDGGITLTQLGSVGFCGGADGLTVYYHRPITE